MVPDSVHYCWSTPRCGRGASNEAALDGRGEAVDLPADDCGWRIRGPGGASLDGERQPDLQMAARSQVSAQARNGIIALLRLGDAVDKGRADGIAKPVRQRANGNRWWRTELCDHLIRQVAGGLCLRPQREKRDDRGKKETEDTRRRWHGSSPVLPDHRSGRRFSALPASARFDETANHACIKTG